MPTPRCDLELPAVLAAVVLACAATLVARSADAAPTDAAGASKAVEARVSGDLRLRPTKLEPRRKLRRAAAARRRRAAAQRARRAAARRKAAAQKPNAAAPAPRTPNDPLWRDAWSLQKVDAPGAWGFGTGSPETIVAVVDTGVDTSHPDLAGALVPGWDFVGDDGDASDDHGHGTAVAGVIAARSDNGIGVASACWSCSIMPVKVVRGDGVGTSDDVAAGIAWAADHGADVINVSLVLTGNDPAVARAVAHAQARGALVVAAAGNAGGEEVTFPAAYPGVLGVAGVDAGDVPYGWSTRGTWIALAAPGCNLTTSLGGGFGEFCGTSSAAAAVSGVAALARSAAGGDARAVAAALAGSATKLPFVASGRIEARATLERVAGRRTA